MSHLVRIALYLNLAMSQLIEGKKKPTYVLANYDKELSEPTKSNEETQVLFVNNQLWIANNNDLDTDTQLELLNVLGINNATALKNHVDKHQGRVINVHANSIYKPKSGKEWLLHELAAADNTLVEPSKWGSKEIYSSSAKNITYTVGNEPKMKGSDEKLVFVKGDYAGVDKPNGSMHAEQKLLAALIRHKHEFFGKTVTFAGCKMACTVCEKVLNNARSRFSNLLSIHFVDNDVDALRKTEKVNLPQVGAPETRDLKFSEYL